MSHQLEELQGEVSRLCTTRENEEEIVRLFLENRDKSLSHTRKEEQLEALVTQAVEGGCMEKAGGL